MQKPSIAIVTICGGRLAHLKQTLPLMLAQLPDRMVVVDYNCPENTEGWVRKHHPEVATVKAHDPAGFSRSRARNLGAEAAGCDLILFADADARLAPGIVDWVRDNLKSGEFVRFVGGTFVCERKAFEAIGGFDEVYRVWGKEDNDIIERLVRAGYRSVRNPGFSVTTIDHSNKMRAQDPKNREFATHMAISTIYYHMKKAALDSGHEMPKARRQEMYDSIIAQIEERPFRLFRVVKWDYGNEPGLAPRRALIVRKIKPGREWSVRMF